MGWMGGNLKGWDWEWGIRKMDGRPTSGEKREKDKEWKMEGGLMIT
jgi:hypothetical protein